MFKRWKERTAQTKAIIAGVVIVIITGAVVIASAFIFPQDKERTGLDPLSGEEVSIGQKSPETYGGIPGAPTFYGTKILLDRGLDADTVHIIKEKLAAYYADYKVESEEVFRFSFAQELNRKTDESGSVYIYTVKVALNVDKMRILTITTDDYGLRAIVVADEDGSNANNIFVISRKKPGGGRSIPLKNGLIFLSQGAEPPNRFPDQAGGGLELAY